MSQNQQPEQLPQVEMLPPVPPQPPVYQPPVYQQPPQYQPQYPQNPYQPPHSPTWDERATEDISTILGFIDNPWQALVMLGLLGAATFIFVIWWHGKKGINILKELRAAPMVNGGWDELKKTVDHIDDEVTKNTKKNERDFKRWEAYCANAKNKKKAECMIPFD